MKERKQKIIFVCAAGEQFLKIGKYALASRQAPKILIFEKETFAPDADGKFLSERFKGILKKLDYDDNNIVFCLPRSQATCRYLKIPSVNPQEVEKIAYLQSSRYLPYPLEELICGYQLIRTKDGCSEINLAVTHKNSVDKYLSIFAEQIKRGKLSVILSSFGLANFFYFLNSSENDPVMLIDRDENWVEIAIVQKDKAFYSRSFKLLRSQPGWQDALKIEINKTKNAFLKEMPEIIIKRVEVLSYPDAAMFGLAREGIPIQLNLLPKGLKDDLTARVLRKERLAVILFATAMAVIWIFGALKGLDNKERYLIRLKEALHQISNEAKPLENIEKRLKMINENKVKPDSGLEILYELHKIIPTQANLISLDYEENKAVVLRGVASEFNFVLSLASELKKSQVFNKFKIKIDHATVKKMPNKEAVEFQINCQK